MRALAASLLLLGVLKHVGYEHFAAAAQAEAWNALGAVTTMSLLAIVWSQHRSPVVGLVVAWWAYEETLVAICSAWRILDWWPVAEGEQQCTARFGPHFASIGLVLIGACIATMSSERRS